MKTKGFLQAPAHLSPQGCRPRGPTGRHRPVLPHAELQPVLPTCTQLAPPAPEVHTWGTHRHLFFLKCPRTWAVAVTTQGRPGQGGCHCSQRLLNVASQPHSGDRRCPVAPQEVTGHPLPLTTCPMLQLGLSTIMKYFLL